MEARKYVVSAPGKVILHGEHAVVYGKRAVAASLGVRTTLTLEVTSDNRVTFDFADINVKVSWSVPDLASDLSIPVCDVSRPCPPSDALVSLLTEKVEAALVPESSTHRLAVAAALYMYIAIALPDTHHIPCIRLTLTSDIPMGAGIGSSASFSTCLAAAFLLLRKAIPEPCVVMATMPGALCWQEQEHLSLVNDWAYEGEKFLHSKPSGVDNCICTYGGALSYQNGDKTHLERVPTLDILLTNTGVTRSTAAIVNKVQENHDKYPDVISPVMDAIDAIATRCVHLFSMMHSQPSQQQVATLEELIDMNQSLLNCIGAGHRDIDVIVKITAGHGLHSKLTGAGGGGCTVTLLPPGFSGMLLSQVREELSQEGFQSWTSCLGGPGLLLHTTA